MYYGAHVPSSSPLLRGFNPPAPAPFPPRPRPAPASPCTSSQGRPPATPTVQPTLRAPGRPAARPPHVQTYARARKASWESRGEPPGWDETAPALLLTKVREGGSGTWGPIPMAPHGHLSEEQIKPLIAGILAIN